MIVYRKPERFIGTWLHLFNSTSVTPG